MLAITIKGLQITVTHLNITDTMRFSQCVNYSLETDPTFWKLDDLLLSIRVLFKYNITNCISKHPIQLKSIQAKHSHWPNLPRAIWHHR